jgi:DNA (cytosine-5)-methyltransferase 1
MKTYAILSIGENKGAPRVWLEGRVPETAGLEPGVRYEVRQLENRKALVIMAEAGGSRVVSRKERGGRSVPVIDLNSRDALGIFAGYTRLRAIVQGARIYLLPCATEAQAQERVERVLAKLQSGTPVAVGSLSHGGGVLSHAIHSGLQSEGLAATLAFANEIRPELIEHAAGANETWSADTIALASPMQELACDPYAMERLPKVEVLEAGLPCSGASVAGRAKRGLALPEEHPEVGHLVWAFLSIVAKVQPAVIVLENVPQYRSTASMAILRNALRDMGYALHETEFEGNAWGALEARKRMCAVAVTRGLRFDPEALAAPNIAAGTLSDVLEPIPADDASWSPMQYLRAKEERDIAAGNGFRLRVLDAGATSVPTITKGVSKRRSTDPMIAHPTRAGLMRIPTPVEHARCKRIPETLVEGLPMTLAHELLGQSVIYPPFRRLGEVIAQMLKRGRVVESAESEDAPVQLALAA